MNTREGLAEVANQFTGHPKLYRGKSASEIAAEFEWDLGGWKYNSINLGVRRWESGWGAVEAQMSNATNTYLKWPEHDSPERAAGVFHVHGRTRSSQGQ